MIKLSESNLQRLYTSWAGWVERLGTDLLLCVHERDDVALVQQEAEKVSRELGIEWQRIYLKLLTRNPTGDHRLELLAGDPALSPQTIGEEWGLRYRLDFAAGYSYGFFLDQRENRRMVQELRPKRLLNLFAYTCSFSVVAASVGAQTCSVDVARKGLEWGKENFALNNLALIGHRFMVDDAREVVRRLAKRGETFDVIVVDPPTFGRSREGKVWQVEKDLAPLVTALLPLLEAGGHLLLSTNYSGWKNEDLLGLVPSTFTPLSVPEMPDIPVEAGAVTQWFRGG